MCCTRPPVARSMTAMGPAAVAVATAPAAPSGTPEYHGDKPGNLSPWPALLIIREQLSASRNVAPPAMLWRAESAISPTWRFLLCHAAVSQPAAANRQVAYADERMQRPPTVFETRVQGRRLVSTTLLEEAKWAARAAARAGEGAKIVNRDTGGVIERHPPRQTPSGSPNIERRNLDDQLISGVRSDTLFGRLDHP
jgi:hypothetical protein